MMMKWVPRLTSRTFPSSSERSPALGPSVLGSDTVFFGILEQVSQHTRSSSWPDQQQGHKRHLLFGSQFFSLEVFESETSRMDAVIFLKQSRR